MITYIIAILYMIIGVFVFLFEVKKLPREELNFDNILIFFFFQILFWPGSIIQNVLKFFFLKMKII